MADSKPRFKAVVLTVSDTLSSSSDASLDTSGALLALRLSAHFSVTRHAAVPDSISTIRSTVSELLLSSHDLVISTGGTGFGTRDVTPEALAPLLHKPTPALTHALTAHSLHKTPMAALSRLVSGIALWEPEQEGSRGTLVVALPGSTKAVKECLEVLLGLEGEEGSGVLMHALDLISGGHGKAVHAAMQGAQGGRDGVAAAASGASLASGTETDTGRAHRGCGRDHSVHSHAAPVSRTEEGGFTTRAPGGAAHRHRQSPYPLEPLERALRLIEEHTPLLGQIETRKLADAVGCILAQDVVAPRNLPPSPTTNVDGYAVHASSTPIGEYLVVRSSAVSPSAPLLEGQVARINTGQSLPRGTDGVVMVEDTTLVAETEAGEEERIKVLAQIEVGENVRAEGSDVKMGQVVLRKGSRVGELGGELGTLAFLGKAQVDVYRKPVVALLSTGNELRDVEASAAAAAGEAQTDEWGFRVWDANRPGLRAAVEGQGFEVLDLGIVGDDLERTIAAMRRGLAQADVILTTGGTSMGEGDLLKPIIERHLGGTIHFGRVAMKPGKPTTFATVPAPAPASGEEGGTEAAKKKEKEKIIFALPGNPASALVCFYVFVLPSLRKLSGLPPSPSASATAAEHGSAYGVPRVRVRLAQSMRLDARPEFHRVVLSVDAKGGLVARSTGSQRSSGMHSMASANGLVCVPALTKDGPKTLEAGSEASAMILGPLVKCWTDASKTN